MLGLWQVSSIASSDLLFPASCLRYAERMREPRLDRFAARDGVELAWRELGEGPTVVLLHGLFSDAEMNWIRFGHAERIASAGFRVIMPDLRAHGLSARPHDAACYSPDILTRDLEDLIAHLSLASFDLGGFSLGGRTTAQAIGTGIRPRRAILAGMGLDSLSNWNERKGFFIDAIARFDSIKRGDPQFMAVQFMKTMKIDRTAAARLLDSLDDGTPEWLSAFTMPTLVVCGEEDHDNGSPAELAAALPNSELRLIRGTHMSSVAEPALGETIAEFLARP